MKTDYKQLAQLFTSHHLQQLSQGNFEIVKQTRSNFFNSNQELSIADIFDESFKLLSRHYANEYIYKNLIIEKLFLKKYDCDKATVLTELREGQRKADCVILNGKSICYEIKTEFDSLQRLDSQLKEYEKLFNEIYVVCAPKFTKKLLDDLPTHIGIIEFNHKLTLKKIRKSNIENFVIDKHLIMQSLRQPEFKMLASQISKTLIDVPNTEIYDYCLSIIENFPNDKKLNKLFIEILKKKRKNDDKTINNFPISLTNAIISYNFLKADLRNLTNIMQLKNGETIDVLSNTSWETT